MSDADKTKEELMTELAHLKQRYADLQQTHATVEAEREELQHALEHYRHVVETASQGIVILQEGRIRYVNDALLHIFGYPQADDLLNRIMTEVLADPDSQRMLESRAIAALAGEPLSFHTWRGIRKDGSPIWIQSTGGAIPFEHGTALLGFFTDVTERQLAEQALQREVADRIQAQAELQRYQHELEQRVQQRTVELQQLNLTLQAEIHERQQTEVALRDSEAKFRGLVENTRQPVLIQRDGQPVFANQALAELHGYDRPEDILQLDSHLELMAPHEHENQRRRQQMCQRGEPLCRRQVQALRQDGTSFWIEYDSTVVPWEGARAVMVTPIDITERRQREVALSESHTLLQSIFDAFSAHIAVLDETGTVVAVNRAWRQFAETQGLAHEQAGVGLNYLEVCEAATGPDATIAQTMAHRLRAVLARECTGVTLEYDCFNSLQEQCWYIVTLAWFENLDQLHVLVIHENVSAYKHLEAQLRQSQKMEAVGTLAGGIAHEFNNILAVIQMSVEYASMNQSPESPALQCLEDIQSASDRAKDLVKQILTFSRQSDISREPINLSVFLVDIMRFLRQSLPTSIDIQHSIQDEALLVRADATQIYQVMMNVCSNAEYAMRNQGGTLTVCLEAADQEFPHTVALSPEQPESYVRLSIHDTGPGIAPELQTRIFDPFFTTKEVGEGTGMGLAIVHGIVSAHGGVITCESSPGHGTTFTIYLPRAHEPNRTTSIPEAPLAHQSRCILFVDDEVLLTRIVERGLTHLGYNIVAHASSQEALEAFAANPHRFDLVVTDQTMPGMTGERLAQALRQLRPDIPIILCTGFSHVMDAATAKQRGIDAFCMKPLRLQELSTTIEQVLS